MLLVFDLDGTLINSRRDLAESANELLEGYGAAPLAEEAVGRMVGEGAGVLVSRVLAARGLQAPHAEALARYLAIYDRRLLDHTVAYDGIEDVLRAFRSTERLAVLTNKPAPPTNRILTALGLDTYFEWVIGGDSRHGKKPSPGALRWLMEQAGTGPGETVLIGDSLVDVQTARAAGTTPVWPGTDSASSTCLAMRWTGVSWSSMRRPISRPFCARVVSRPSTTV